MLREQREKGTRNPFAFFSTYDSLNGGNVEKFKIDIIIQCQPKPAAFPITRFCIKI
jgi:hypothetical protein